MSDTDSAFQGTNISSLEAARMSKAEGRRNSAWRQVVNNLDPRGFLGRIFGTQFNGLRDLYAVFGWDRSITPTQMWHMYLRGGIASRVIHAYPDTIWGQPPELKATQTFKKAWEVLCADWDLWILIHKLDVLMGMDRFAILVVGTNDSGKMDQPVNTGRVSEILYLQPYGERSVVITKWGNDPKDARFGLPMEYTVYPGKSESEDQTLMSGRSVRPSGMPSFKVHWSRVIHFKQGALESPVYGKPKLLDIWNYLTDLQKVVGGASESYWLTANRGMNVNVNPELEMDPADEAALSEELDEYQHGLRRFIRTRGAEVKALGEGVADPTGPFDTLVALIAGTKKIPRRILLGSEAAHNASTQDKGNWAIAVEENRALVSGPEILKPLILGLIRLGLLPKIASNKLEFVWADAYRLSPLEEGQRANQRATALNNVTLAVKNVRNLASVEELRDFVGLPEEKKGTTKPEIVDPQPAQPFGGGGRGRQPKKPDGGTSKPGNKSGTTSTPTSDQTGNPPPTQK